MESNQSRMSAYFDLLNSAYTGELDRFKKVASCCDKRDEGLSITIQRLVDGDGRGSLAFAAAGGRVNVCRYLLEELNLDVDVKDNNGITPLCYGAVKGQLNTVEYLLEKGANPDGSNDPNSTTNTPLHYAVLGGDRKIQTVLLSKGIHINVATRSGTALSYAALLGQVDAVKVLLDHCADPNVVLFGVVTPLTSTIVNNSPQIMDLLLQAGADPNAKSCRFAPLILAVKYGLTQFVVRLLEAGADPNVTDHEGMTAVEIAAKEGNYQIVQILFPVTSCIPTYPNWTIGGLMEHVHSEATKKKKKIQNLYLKQLKMKNTGHKDHGTVNCALRGDDFAVTGADGVIGVSFARGSNTMDICKQILQQGIAEGQVITMDQLYDRLYQLPVHTAYSCCVAGFQGDEPRIAKFSCDGTSAEILDEEELFTTSGSGCEYAQHATIDKKVQQRKVQLKLSKKPSHMHVFEMQIVVVK
ncbi:hypothetical protein MKW98_028614 [Papaver atlanticum]|uniref:Uncharacterized protein n=1 Tax=Papaver atlanticum TaxID=357466 RepID=A0AAD4X7J2_9MAGN|nr:hypothetical protein MKW98_028614 [Papaver atlanticum]